MRSLVLLALISTCFLDKMSTGAVEPGSPKHVEAMERERQQQAKAEAAQRKAEADAAMARCRESDEGCAEFLRLDGVWITVVNGLSTEHRPKVIDLMRRACRGGHTPSCQMLERGEPPRTCCKVCGRTSQPCGDTCISLDKTCHVGVGCACP